MSFATKYSIFLSYSQHFHPCKNTVILYQKKGGNYDMQDHGVTFPEVSDYTKHVLVAALSQLHRQDEWAKVMDKLGIPKIERYQIENELESVQNFFRRVQTREMKKREEQHGEERLPSQVNPQ